MPKLLKRRAYLVSVAQEHQAVRVYAVLATTPDEALKVVVPNIPSNAQVEIVGGLSRDLVKRLRLEPGELRLV